MSRVLGNVAGKVVTGIPGMDELLDGGLLERSVIMLSGTPGTGKTIFAMQFLLEGAKRGEKGMYVSLEESVSDIAKNMSQFGWDIAPLTQQGTIMLTEFKIAPAEITAVPDTRTFKQLKTSEPATIMDLYAAIHDAVQSGGIKRVVIDSMSVLKFVHEGEKESRTELASLFKFFKQNNVIVLVVGERKSADEFFDFEDFLADGVIVLRDYPSQEERKRGITVVKMRGTKTDRATRPYQITDKGIIIYPNEHIL